MIKYNAKLTFMRMTLGKDYVDNKSGLKNISLSIHYSKGKWYFGLLAAALILSVAISGEFSLTSSKAYAEGQIYRMKVQHNPMLLTSTSAVEQQGTQQPTRNQTEMQESSSTQNATIHDFENAFIEIVNDTRSLSIAYQDEIAKLESGVYDNQTFVTITDLYLQRYQELLARADALRQWPSTLPMNYSRAIELYSESIRTEMMSQEHFRNYLSTGDLSENERSLELLSESLRFEIEAFNAFRSGANDTAIQDGTDSINNATDAIFEI